MGVNYTNITYDTGYPTPSAIHLNNYDGDQTVDGLDVDVSLKGPAEWTPTHYKLWNINGVTTSGAASWEVYVGTTTGELIEQSGEQHVYGEFKDASHMSGIITSSGITFSWVEPTTHSTADWEDSWSSLKFGSAGSATLKNTIYNTEVSISKSNVAGLHWSGKDFSDIEIQGDTIVGTSAGYLGGILEANANNYVTITKTFSSSAKPFVYVDAGSGFTTLTTYTGGEKSGLGGDYTGRIANYNWNSGTKTLTFDVLRFSTYGFCVIDKVEFTNDSQTAGYNGTSISLKVYVQDTNGEAVENAPVTFSGVAGATIGNFSANPVNTGSDGIATATLNLTSVGNQTFDAYVDTAHTDPDQYTECQTFPASIGRSLIRQYEQIRRTGTYDDLVADINTSSVAEPTTTTGTHSRLEHDGNVLRTLMKQLKGGTNWYDDPGMMYDPTNTNSGSGELETFNMSNIKGHFLRNKTVLLAVDEDNSGAGYTVTSGTAGVLSSNVSTVYTTQTVRTGLPIFSSTGSDLPDEGGSDNVCAVDVIDSSTGGEFKNASGHLVYAKMHDGLDYPPGSGTGTDVYFKFYANNVSYTFDENDPTNVSFVYPLRRRMSDVEEYEWLRTDFVSSYEGDDELVEDITNLWNYTGAANNDTAPTWDNTGANYSLLVGSTDLEAGINDLNNAIDDMTFTEDNYISDGDTVADALNKLDQQVKINANNIIAGSADKYVEELSGDVAANVTHGLSFTYTPDSTSGREGKNMDVWVDGQKMAASTGAAGIAADRDYAEVTTSGIAFHMDLYSGSNITYRVRN